MRQFPYAPRTQSSVYRGDAAAAARQQQQSPPPLPPRDTMSDMQEQFSKLAESTSSQSSERILFSYPTPGGSGLRHLFVGILGIRASLLSHSAFC